MKEISLSDEEEKRAVELHRRSIFINALDAICYPELLEEMYFAKLKQGSVTAINMTSAWVDDNFYLAAKKMSRFHSIFDQFRHLMIPATTTEEIVRAKDESKIAVIMGLQSPKPIEDDLNLLMLFCKLGLRIMVLAYQKRSLIGDGVGEKVDCGLSDFGSKVIEEMNRLGVVIDLSHVGKRTSLEAIETSKQPVIFSHSNARSVCDHIRNLSDEQLKALAENGGVVGCTIAAGGQTVKKESPKLEDYLDHIDYIRNLVGIDHVGIGLDYSLVGRTRERFEAVKRSFPELRKGYTWKQYIKPPVTTLKQPSDWVNITRGLVKRGYTDEEIRKVLGGNFMRVFKTVWRR